MSKGINWGRFPMANGQLPNVDASTGIRYGVIPVNAVEWWSDSSEPDYGEPHCPECEGDVLAADDPKADADAKSRHDRPGRCYDHYCPECKIALDSEECYPEEALSYEVDEDDLRASASSDSADIFVFKSPYFTRASFCSPCAPGACYLLSHCLDGEKAYCFGHDWFEDGDAPYPVYSVQTGERVLPPRKDF